MSAEGKKIKRFEFKSYLEIFQEGCHYLIENRILWRINQDTDVKAI